MFNEHDWLKLLSLLNDTQNWLDEMGRETIYQLPVSEKRKFRRKSYYLTIPALAHIMEKHYCKVARYPYAAKFTLPVVEILDYIRDAFALPVNPVPGTLNYQRIVEAGRHVGYDRDGQPVENITIITDAGGRIITAFPGFLRSSEIAGMEKDTDGINHEKEAAINTD